MSIEVYRINGGPAEGESLAAGTARPAQGRPTAYVSARFTAASQTCVIYLRYLQDDGTTRDGRSDSRTLTATAERDGADGSSGNYVAADEPFDLPCHSYAIVVETAPGSGSVTFSVREVGP